MSDPLGWRNIRNSYEVLDASPLSGEASRLMCQYAERLARKRMTKRFGVKNMEAQGRLACGPGGPRGAKATREEGAK